MTWIYHRFTMITRTTIDEVENSSPQNMLLDAAIKQIEGTKLKSKNYAEKTKLKSKNYAVCVCVYLYSYVYIHQRPCLNTFSLAFWVVVAYNTCTHYKISFVCWRTMNPRALMFIYIIYIS